MCMVKTAGKQRTVTPLNPSQTLFETGSRDIWQLPFYSSDGCSYGVVIRQVIEPSMYTVRYLVIYSPEHERHIVVPASTLRDITPEAVISELTRAELDSLPSFQHSLSRSEEATLYKILNRTPYWIEEQEVMTPGRLEKDDPSIE